MRILCKRNLKSYHKLKQLYEKDCDKVFDDYNDDNDMVDFINDWYKGDDAGTNESFLRAKALQQIYKGSKLSRLSASLLILNLQSCYG